MVFVCDQVGSEDNDLSLNESGSFATLFRKKGGPDKTQKTLERNKKDEEKRKHRENVSVILSICLWDNSVNLHECSPLCVVIFI